jgi:HD-GYP domain-containing protein (c-di-GMP phosphodiesterase class II)
MTDLPDPSHFVRAVTQLGEKTSVVAHSAIYNAQGFKLIDKGVAIDARLYDRLTQHRLKVPLADSVSSESGVTGQAVHNAAVLMCAQQPFFGAMVAEPSLRAMLLEELRQMPLPTPVAFHLTLARETQPELWMHSLRSAVTAGWLVARRGGARHDVRMVAVGALVHDLGMLYLDPVLQQPAAVFGGAERRQLDAHPLVTAMLIERHHGYPRELLRAVLEHHETLDGTGYPRNVAGAGLSAWGRVLSLTEVVTAMFSIEKHAPAMRLSLLLRMNRHRYDADLVHVLMPLIAAAREDWQAPAGTDPRETHGEIDALLRAWPVEAPDGPGSERADIIDTVHAQCAQVLRNMSDTGASTEQLAQLGEADVDGALLTELSLVTHEALWQLKAAARHARRRWRLAPDETVPPWLQQWLDRVDALGAART